jgi:hypothetical protein
MTSISPYEIVRKLPVFRITTYSTLPYHLGSVIENRLGLQVWRMLAKHLAWRLRKKVVDSDIRVHVEALERDGILVIEDFLDAESFAGVVAEFEAATAAVPLAPYKSVENARLYRTQIAVAERPEQFNLITEHFQENVLLNAIASATIRRPISSKPRLFLDVYRNLNAEGKENDIENILHADLHTPTVKMFFYINDVDHNNGAFIYAKGSHRLTLARLMHEYDLSNRTARLSKGLPVPEHLLCRRAGYVRNIIRPEYWRRMGFVETQINAKQNTLVIANNMGFHRRGEFNDGRPRKAILINYRHAEPLV